MKSEYTFPSNDGKTTIHAVRWMPENGEFTAVLQIVHGMIEFIERYDEFASFLADQGYLVVGHDHIGHGQSISTKADWGYFCEKDPATTLTEDIHKHRILVQKEYPDKPYFILGHSMGSYLLRKYLADYGDGLAGAVIMGTGFVPTATSNFGMALVRTLAKFKGWHANSTLVEAMTFGKPYRKFDLTGQDPANSWLSRDPEIAIRASKEPRSTFRFTLNGFLGLLQAVNFSCRQSNVNAIPKELPILITSGDDDPVGDLGAGVAKVYKMYQKAGFADLTCKMYPGARHEILNETNRAEVYEDIRQWMEARK